VLTYLEADLGCKRKPFPDAQGRCNMACHDPLCRCLSVDSAARRAKGRSLQNQASRMVEMHIYRPDRSRGDHDGRSTKRSRLGWCERRSTAPTSPAILQQDDITCPSQHHRRSCSFPCGRINNLVYHYSVFGLIAPGRPLKPSTDEAYVVCVTSRAVRSVSLPCWYCDARPSLLLA
jgi:hypothetical protein